MARFIAKRIIFGFVTLWVIVTITFFLLHALPGDPFMSEKAIPKDVKQSLMEMYHLDKPLFTQYGYYLSGLFQGDLGISMKMRGRTVTDIISQHFPYSLDLGLRSLVFAVFFGIPLGILAGLYRGKKTDTAAMICAIAGVSVPSFVLGGILQWAVLRINALAGTELLPVAEYRTFLHTILPAIALGLFPLAVIARMMRASVIEVMSQDYVKTAKAKGVSPKSVIMRHVLRNAVMPVITYLGPFAAAVTTGTFVIEKIFVIPGLGRFYVESIQVSDYTVVLGITVFYSAILIFVVVLVDIAYGFIDPRVRLSRSPS
jgi:oligopeptide transport system permease protein